MSRLMRAEPPPEPAAAPSSRRWAIADVAFVFLRVATGLLFMTHGLQKLFGFFGGVLLAAGLFTRPVAVVLAGEMVIAYFIAHLPRGVMPLQNGGEVALLYALIFVFFAPTPRPRD